ncbi:hypothetical protein [Saccharothrix syringae]|uniref:hypothetical protein n=1 Tax=Saccharothrix syringae TaxID=103733 RepID=UPI0005259F1C|nr:hypothetical protein [Saccharothrix syringae]
MVAGELLVLAGLVSAAGCALAAFALDRAGPPPLPPRLDRRVRAWGRRAPWFVAAGLAVAAGGILLLLLRP